MAVIGFTIVLLAIVIFVLPFPLGWVVLPVGLVILAGQFVWARWLLTKIRRQHHLLDTTLGAAEKQAKAFEDKLFGPDEDPDSGLRRSA